MARIYAQWRPLDSSGQSEARGLGDRWGQSNQQLRRHSAEGRALNRSRRRDAAELSAEENCPSSENRLERAVARAKMLCINESA
jgi:hypothetical protein